MKTIVFSTNIKCAGCIANTRDYLNNAVGEGNWQVDITDPAKKLTVNLTGDRTATQVIDALKVAGYKAEILQEAG